MNATSFIRNETCLLHSDIDLVTNNATASLEGYAHDPNGNEWELSAYVNVKWKRIVTAFGKCECGGNMVSKAPNNKNARVRCSKCGSQMLLENWKRIAMTPNDALCSPGVGAGEAHNKL